MAQLSVPITRGEGETITAVTVLKPTSGALRGLKLLDLMQLDVASLAKLLPRVTEPALFPAEVAALDPRDLLKLSVEVQAFFVDASMTEAIETSL